MPSLKAVLLLDTKRMNYISVYISVSVLCLLGFRHEHFYSILLLFGWLVYCLLRKYQKLDIAGETLSGIYTQYVHFHLKFYACWSVKMSYSFVLGQNRFQIWWVEGFSCKASWQKLRGGEEWRGQNVTSFSRKGSALPTRRTLLLSHCWTLPQSHLSSACGMQRFSCLWCFELQSVSLARAIGWRLRTAEPEQAIL